VSGWDAKWDIEQLEAQLRARDGRESLDAEIEHEVHRIRRMFDEAKRRLGLASKTAEDS
jgi:hypothetical protein